VAADDQQKIVQYMAEKYSIEAKAIGQYLAHVMVVAREVNLDPLLLFAVMAIESNFNPLAQSPAGAQGLMQVLTRLHEEKFVPYGGPGAAFKPEANIRVGAYILKHFIAISGSIHGGLRHYVGGAVIGDGGYVGKVLREREQLITLLSEKTNLSDNSANLKQTISR
jgi:soluble lytic murein transglycosylase-like protein